MLKTYSLLVIRWRFLVIAISIIGAVLIASGGKNLTFDTDYRVFFSDDNPDLLAFEKLQNTYSKEDNILIALTPKNGELFTPKNLSAIEWLTKEAWKIPFARRVDSLTNFQHIRGVGDELIVEDLAYKSINMSTQQALNARKIALSEPSLLNAIVNPTGTITAINIVNQFTQSSKTEVPTAINYTRKLIKQFSDKYPQFDVHVTGITALNNAFDEASMFDMQNLIPIMYLFIFITLFLLLRSVAALFGVAILIVLSIMSAMGMAGWMHISLTPPSVSAPTIIMTLAVADAVHFLIVMLGLMRKGMEKNAAIQESLRINMFPIFLTSITTVIGFLAMNASDTPPFHDLGNITAFGVAFAFIFSVFFLPAWMSIMPVRVKVNSNPDKKNNDFFDKFANFVIAKYKILFIGSACVIIFALVLIPKVEFNDNFIDYFDESIQFREDSDYVIKNLTGINMLFYSVGVNENNKPKPQGINSPIFMRNLDNFKNWLYQQSEVIHVRVLSDTMKSLNKNLHGGDDKWYKTPENKELSAQYLLLYEMSLPYGLDLNNQINVDKSATKIGITLKNITTKELLAFNVKSDLWMKNNFPKHVTFTGASTALMFANITQRNIQQMISGSIIALVLISIILIFALRSFKLGLLSLVPNLSPVIVATGIWILIFGEVGLAASIVFATSIGIVVDDTVHFLSKYMRARREKGLNAENSIRYAFSTVGHALWITTIVLVVGFALLSQSSFLVNQQTGILMAITISVALVLDFLLLPSLLLFLDKEKTLKA